VTQVIVMSEATSVSVPREGLMLMRPLLLCGFTRHPGASSAARDVFCTSYWGRGIFRKGYARFPDTPHFQPTARGIRDGCGLYRLAEIGEAEHPDPDPILRPSGRAAAIADLKREACQWFD
jgi:hypothetical protein